jgi:hypothetical protein
MYNDVQRHIVSRSNSVSSNDRSGHAMAKSERWTHLCVSSRWRNKIVNQF